MKIMGFGFNHFFYGPERWWNAFDLVIITTSVIETFLDWGVWVMPVSVYVFDMFLLDSHEVSMDVTEAKGCKRYVLSGRMF